MQFLFTDKFKSQYDYNTKVEIHHTEKMEAALNHLKDSFSVVLFGRPGEGKTAAAFRLVKSLIDDKHISLKRCALLFEPDDIKDIRSKDLDLVLIDDMFGKHNTEVDKVSGWRRLLSSLQAFAGNHEVRIIVTSRTHIYLECKHELDGMGEFEKVVELNSQDLSLQEKRLILKSQLNYYDKKVDDGEIEVCISQKESDVGFPLCSQQFSSDMSKNIDYFSKPYKYYLEQNLRNLDDQSTIALLYVFYKDNKLKVEDLDITEIDADSERVILHIAKLRGVEKPLPTLIKETKDKINHFQNSYVKCINRTNSFLHDTMYEAVALIHGESYPSEVIKHCTLDFFCQFVHVENLRKEEGFYIEDRHFPSLVQRCIKEVQDENGKRISNHPIFTNKFFVDKFFTTVTDDEDTFKAFLSTGLTFMYVGNHAFLYHVTASNSDNKHFFESCLRHLKCNHTEKMKDQCWKCPVKSEALVGACSANREESYRNLRSAGARVKQVCLYKAVENKLIESRFVKQIIDDLKDAKLFTPTHQDLQFCMGMSLEYDNKTIFNLLKGEGLTPTDQVLYFIVRKGDENMLSNMIEQLKQQNIWVTEGLYVSRALLEAHLSKDGRFLKILESAGAKLTEGAVYWAIVDHGFDEVKIAINLLKGKDRFDVESVELSWGIAMAMQSDDKRIYKYLKDIGIISTSALVVAMAYIGQSAEDIETVITDLKNYERWDPLDLKNVTAYMVACERSDKSLKELLSREGVGLTSASLNYVVVEYTDDRDDVFDTLKKNKSLNPFDLNIARALVWATQNKNRSIVDKLHSENITLNMASLVSAVDPFFYMSTLEMVIHGIKRNNKWNPNTDYALHALNDAVRRNDPSVHQKLIEEGLKWKERNLYLAVQKGTVWGLKQVIKHMKTMKLIKPEHEDIKAAIILADSFKDKRKFRLLNEEVVV